MNNNSISQQRELAEWISKTNFCDFPEEVVSHTKALLLKTVAGMIMGRREHVAPILTRYATAMGGTPEAGVVAGGFRTSVETAAFVNATIAHASELEDNQVPEQLSTFWVFPAFFSLAEKYQCTGREMIEAAVISFEIYSRYGRALGAVEMMQKMRTVPPSFFGPVAVAAGAAKMMKLSVDQIETAMSIAATHSCGICSGGHPGFDLHFLESGSTCRNGIMAALLAKEGITAATCVLETAVKTFGNVCFPEKGDADVLTEGLGTVPYSILDCRFKKYSACTLTHPAVDAFGLLAKEHGLKDEDIESIEILSGEHVHRTVSNTFNPATLEQARFSTPFLIAEILLYGKVDEDTYSGPEKVQNQQNIDIQKKITAVRMDDVSFGHVGAKITVVTKDGKTLVKELEDRIGSPAYPLTLEQVVEISRPFLASLLNTADCERVEEIMVNLDTELDMLEVMDIITYCRVGSRERFAKKIA